MLSRYDYLVYFDHITLLRGTPLRHLKIQNNEKRLMTHPVLSTPQFQAGYVYPSTFLQAQSEPTQGSWGGTGARKQPTKPHLIKKIAGVDPTTRSDHNKKHVIISEKRDKKAAKYMVKDLPYPYTSKAQYERSIDTPLGTEWNTRVGFQRGTLPRVVKKVSRFQHVPIQQLFIGTSDGHCYRPFGEGVLSIVRVSV